MATSTYPLPIRAATPPDGSTGNLAPGIRVRKGTQASAPQTFHTVAQFDAATSEFLHWTFRVPADYLSGGALKIPWIANAVTATAVVWAARLSAVTPGDADTPIEHVFATAQSVTSNTNTTEALRLTTASLTITNLDSLAAGDLVTIVFYRDAANGADTLAIDAELFEQIVFEYTS